MVKMHTGDPSADPVRREVVDEIAERFRQLNWRGRSRLRRRLDRFGLTVPQFVVLSTVRRLGPGAPMSSVSDAIQLPRSSMTSIADRLCEMGLARRAPLEGDRRAVGVTITESGCELVATVESEGNADLLLVSLELRTDDLTGFLETLKSLGDGLDKLGDTSSVAGIPGGAPTNGQHE